MRYDLYVDVTTQTTAAEVLISAHKDGSAAGELSLTPNQTRSLARIVALIREVPGLLEGLAKLDAAAEIAELEAALTGDAV